MAERRSLGAALDLSPEKQAFIQSGTTPSAPVSPKPHAALSPLEPERADEEMHEAPPAESRATRTARRSRGRRAARVEMNARESLDAFPGITNLLVPLTTRLQPSTAAALKRAGLEQRLRGREPATVQEIAEEAIQGWLQDNGYLD